MAPQEYERDLLMEAEGLDYLSKLFQGFDNLLDGAITEYGEYLQPQLVVVLEVIRYEINLTLSGKVVVDHKKIPGILLQLEDVQDEIQVLQAGLPTKQGIEGEDCDDS